MVVAAGEVKSNSVSEHAAVEQIPFNSATFSLVKLYKKTNSAGQDTVTLQLTCDVSHL